PQVHEVATRRVKYSLIQLYLILIFKRTNPDVRMVVVFFLLLCAQFLSNLALETEEENNPINVNGSGFNKEGLKRDALVFSKASKVKGSSGGQNDHIKKNNGVSTFIKSHTYGSYVDIGVIVFD
ncbi:hypothetical protein M8C21_022243, partial [Ambrosia artemisiifolia]